MSGSRWLLAAALCLAPATARATAGFAERHTDLAYNDLAAVHWIHPGDGCDCGGTCFQLVRRNDRFGRFAGLECSLGRLSLPASALMWCGVLLLPPLSVAWFVLRVVLGAGHGLGR